MEREKKIQTREFRLDRSLQIQRTTQTQRIKRLRRTETERQRERKKYKQENLNWTEAYRHREYRETKNYKT